jgi:leucyl-tRNA synthetase
VDGTVLANEQVINGRAERSGALVESRFLSQWCIKTNSFAKQLDKDLDILVRWPKHIVKTQKAWIGSVYGRFIDVSVCSVDVALFLEDGLDKLRSSGHVVVSATNQLVIDRCTNVL